MLNSKCIHKYEKYVERIVILDFILFTFYIFKKIPVLDLVIATLLLITLFMLFKHIKHNKQFLQQQIQGNFQRIYVIQSDLIKDKVCYEIHHRPFTLKEIISTPSKILKKRFIEELKQDYEELYNKSSEDVLIVTTTHPSMARIWNKTSSPYFQLKQIDTELDPYIKPNIFLWLLSAIRTSKSIKRRPVIWNSYFFQYR